MVLIRRDTDQVRLVREEGLWLETPSGARSVRPEIVSNPAEAGKVDLALVLVKAYDTEGAIPAAKEILGSDGYALTLQNGVGNYEILEDAFPKRALLGTTTNGALALGPGKVRHTGIGQTHFGEYDGSSTERTGAIAGLLEKIDFGPVHVVKNAVGCVWSKLIINAAINAPATLLQVRNGDLAATEPGKGLIHQIVEECLNVVRAKGIELIFDDPEGQVIAVCQATAQNINSMFQDIRAGRKTEIDFINSAVAREAKVCGVDARTNETLALLVKSLEETAGARVSD